MYRYQYPARPWLILPLVAAFHLLLLWYWPAFQAPVNSQHANTMHLVLLSPAIRQTLQLPEPAWDANVSTSAQRNPERMRQRTVSATSQVSSATQTPTKEQLQSEPEHAVAVESANSATSAIPAPASTELKRDVRGLFSGLKKEFDARDRVLTAAEKSAFAKFADQIARSGTVNHEGVKHELHIMGDGRPVSKIITPFGTYCIMHRKPGELLGNEMPTIPMSCGNL
ncbi:hypothetical protein [Undibacterium rugosum]|uniref:Uncharacterized protein n=1 Tax=Undibacterium rugosum TaxID=2762291 RepID=A0A923I7V8_9BURK|nr:hypothetical protein [Undibacterium rugosum]MBC3935188.1 hypothetical protein [Undibacterium rugosum]MBR7777782.1 hypothetical protein [Undibacterium rugosum]